MANSNIEKFLIEFGFKDKKVIDDLKTLSNLFSKIEKRVERAGKAETKAIKKTTKAQKDKNNEAKKANSIAKSHLALKKKIDKAESLGVDVTGYKKSLGSIKKPSTFAEKSIQLDNAIYEKEQQLKKAKKEQAKLDDKSKALTKEKLETEKAIAKLRKSYEKDSEAQAKRLIKSLNTRENRIEKIHAATAKKLAKEKADKDKTLKEEARDKKRQADEQARDQKRLDRDASENRKKLDREEARLRRQALQEERKATMMRRFETSSNFQAIRRADPAKAGSLLSAFGSTLAMDHGAERGEKLQSLQAIVRDQGRLYKQRERQTIGLATAQSSLHDSTRHMIRSYASLYTVFASLSSINQVGQSFEAVNSAMLAAMGSQEEATSRMKFLDELTSRLGMSLIDTADQYTKFVFASKGKLPTEEVDFLFQSLSEMGTVLGVSKERMKLSMTAIQQMMNKGTVSSEELKRQFAESMPGGIQLFANALNVSEAELFKQIESGSVLAKDVLPLVAKEMAKVANSAGALEAKYKTTRVAQGRFFKQLETAQKTIFENGFDEGLAEIFTELTKVFTDNKATLQALGRGFGVVFKVIGVGIKAIEPLITSLVFDVTTLIDAFNGLFGDYGKYVIGIMAIAGAAKYLGKVLNKSLFIVTALLMGMSELISLMSEGVVGRIEQAIGKDVALSNTPNLTNFKSPLLGVGSGSPLYTLGNMAYQNYLGGKDTSPKVEVKQELNIQLPRDADEDYIIDVVKREGQKMNRTLYNQSYVKGQ